jgi:alkylation response protein AidB-like acyl-CoA dehydrogenase
MEWSDVHLEMRAALRKFVETQVRPHRESLEYGEPPYELLRSMYKTFGLAEAAAERFDAIALGRPYDDGNDPQTRAVLGLLPLIELSRCSPGMVTALGVSVGLTAHAILSQGTAKQRRRWARDLLTLDSIGAWAITESTSGSDAFGGMRALARPHRDGWVLSGSKTFITNGPYADTLVILARIDDGGPSDGRPVGSFVLDGDQAGLTRSAPLRKMGMHASPTGELFLHDVVVSPDRLLGEAVPARRATGAQSSRGGAKATFTRERATVAAIALGIIERCLELCTAYARERIQFGRPIGSFQLVQQKLAHMEVARLNVEALVFRYLSAAAQGRALSLAAASAMKLYAAGAAVQTAMDAVQIFGGNGYMSEFEVEQLARDAKALQIYGGTDEIQITHVARDLLKAPHFEGPFGNRAGQRPAP